MNNVNNTEIMNNVNNTGPIMSTGLPKKCGLQSCVAGMWLSHQDLILGNTRQERNTSKVEAQSKRSPKILNIYNQAHRNIT